MGTWFALKNYAPPKDWPINNIPPETTAEIKVQASPVGKMATVIVREGTMRDKPSNNGAFTRKVVKGEQYKVLTEQAGWYLLQVDGVRSGWLRSIYARVAELEPEPLEQSDPPVDITGTELGKELSEICRSYSAAGVGVAVILDGKVVYTYEYGYMNKARKTQVVPDTKFRIASMSKVITLMAVMTLEQQGDIMLDDDFSDYMGYAVRNPWSGCSDTPITLRHILTHTSSLRDTEIVESESQQGSKLKDALKRGRNYFQSVPGTYWSYSNSGYGVIGAAVEIITDVLYADYVNCVFFDPMELDASFSGGMIREPDLVADCYLSGAGIKRTREQVLKDFRPRPPGETYFIAQGNCIISAKDYAEMMTILINDGKYRGRTFLSQDAIKKIHEICTGYTNEQVFQQALALRYMENMYEGHDLYYHTGKAYGVLSLCCYDRKQKSGVVVITSGAMEARDEHGVYAPCSDLVELLYKKVIDVPAPLLDG